MIDDEPQTKVEMDYDMHFAEQKMKDMKIFSFFGNDTEKIKEEYIKNPLFFQAVNMLIEVIE